MSEIRSFLFVPGDSEKKIAKGLGSGADALILDLEDSVAPSAKPLARKVVADALGGPRPTQLWVRINPLDSGLSDDDLAAINGLSPDGIMLPKASGPKDVAALSAMLDTSDPDKKIKILPITTETAASPFRLGEYVDADLPRLWGLTWGAEDLATDLGASANKDATDNWLPTFQTVRSLCLMAARATGVQPIDTLFVDFKNTEGLAKDSAQSRVEGFTGRLAIHPAQVPAINAAYAPSPNAIAYAKRVVAAFAAQQGAGVVGIDGKMVDIPHLKQAQAILSRATAFGVDEP